MWWLLSFILLLADVAVGQDNFTVRDSCEQPIATKISKGVEPSIKLEYAILIMLGFGVFSALVALAFHLVRKYVYHDADNLDTHFDAGGKVSIGLTATTIVSQWTWSATLLQSSTVASKYGISGPYWYAAGATIQVILFAILSIQLKTKAPGAKTFLQVVYARFGKPTHIVFLIFACFTNLVVTASLLLGGTAVLTSLVQGLSLELACMILAIIIGSYTLIGGLGATFYVSYFNTTLIFIALIVIVVEIFHNPSGSEDNPFGGSAPLYRYLDCIEGPEDNEEGSYLTFLSLGGLMFGIINIVGNFGTVFCDQAYWQSSVAAKPMQGVWGFVSGGLTWFSIPFTLATSMGLAYLGISAWQREAMLNDGEIDAGLVVPVVAQRLLGESGEYLVLLLILMAIMSTGSAEVIAISSIIVYDIYQVYINPYQKDFIHGYCVLCNKMRSFNPMLKSNFTTPFVCQCQPAKYCKTCQEDMGRQENARKIKAAVKPHLQCKVHGRYRQYLEQLLSLKSWCIVWVTAATIPLVLLANAAQLNLSWVYLFTGVLIGSAVVPISLSILWSRVNNKGMISGGVTGCICAIIAWLVTASTFEGGLGDFIKNTGQIESMLAGNVTAIGVGGIVCVLVSCITNRNMQEDDVIDEWEKTREIDNPLNPWSEVYKEDFGHLTLKSNDVRPSVHEMNALFKKTKWIAYITGIILTILFIFIWPGIMAGIKVLSESGFNGWVILAQIWAFLAAIYIIFVPLIQEVYGICMQVKENRETERNKRTLEAKRKSFKQERIDSGYDFKPSTLAERVNGGQDNGAFDTQL